MGLSTKKRGGFIISFANSPRKDSNWLSVGLVPSLESISYKSFCTNPMAAEEDNASKRGLFFSEQGQRDAEQTPFSGTHQHPELTKDSQASGPSSSS